MARIALLATGLLLLLSATALAEELDVMDCRSVTVNLLHGSKEMTLLGFDLKGITISRNDNKAWDSASTGCVGVSRIDPTGSTANGLCKWQDADGDLVFAEWSRANPNGGVWSYLGGTGKWKGIKGGGDWAYLKRTKPIAPGTVQGCIVITGTYQVGG